MFTPITIPFGAVMLFNVVKLKDGVTVEDVELALGEMYVQGVSTRKVKAITEQLCGHEFSASTISRINKKLDRGLAKFAKRKLEEYVKEYF